MDGIHLSCLSSDVGSRLCIGGEEGRRKGQKKQCRGRQAGVRRSQVPEITTGTFNRILLLSQQRAVHRHTVIRPTVEVVVGWL